MCIIWIAVSTVFMRFVHYDSQYRLLNPEHYNVDVITQEDYQQLANPENRSVELTNGRTLKKSDMWDSHVLPKYKPVDEDSRYVLVTLRGTAPFMQQWYSDVLPIAAVCVIGLFWRNKRCVPEKK